MRALIALFIFLFFIHAFAQEKNKYGTYYNQKKSLFEMLPNDKNEIIFLGNSITDGCEWSELFGDLRIKNRGISADISQGVFERLGEVTESKPLQIFLMIGVNDLSRDIGIDTIVQNYVKIIDKIEHDSKETQLFIQSVLPVNDAFPRFKKHVNKSGQIIELNERLAALCSKKNVTYIDLYGQFTNEEGKLNTIYTNDGLHLTGAGYLKWKEIVEEYLKK